MALETRIQIYNSVTTTNAPATDSLAQGELAVNIADKKLWVGPAGGTGAPVLLVDGSSGGSYLLLDASNGPLTGDLTIQTDAAAGTFLTIDNNSTSDYQAGIQFSNTYDTSTEWRFALGTTGAMELKYSEFETRRFQIYNDTTFSEIGITLGHSNKKWDMYVESSPGALYFKQIGETSAAYKIGANTYIHTWTADTGGSTGTACFYWKNNTSTNLMILKDNAYLGIGNTTGVVDEKLHVEETTANPVYLKIENSNAVDQAAGIKLTNTQSSGHTWTIENDSLGALCVTSNVRNLEIKAHSSYGWFVSRTSAAADLPVVGTWCLVDDGASAIEHIVSFGAEPQIVAMRSTGSLASPTALLGSKNILSISGIGYATTNWGGTGAAIRFVSESAWSSSSYSTEMVFETCATGSTSAAVRMVIAQDGKIGIGAGVGGGESAATNVDELLHIDDTGAAATYFKVENSNATDYAAGIKLTNSYSTGETWIIENNAAGQLSISAALHSLELLTTTAGAPLQMSTTGIADSTGYGTLCIIEEGTASQYAGVAYGATAVFRGYRANGTEASPTTLVNGSTIANFGANGYDGTGWASTSCAAIKMVAGGTWSATSTPAYIIFQTTDTGTTTLTTQVTIDDNGWVGIGAGFGAIDEKLHVENTSTQNTYIKVENSNATDQEVGIKFTSTYNTSTTWFWALSTTGTFYLQNAAQYPVNVLEVSNSGDTFTYSAYTGNNAKLVIDAMDASTTRGAALQLENKDQTADINLNAVSNLYVRQDTGGNSAGPQFLLYDRADANKGRILANSSSGAAASASDIAFTVYNYSASTNDQCMYVTTNGNVHAINSIYYNGTTLAHSSDRRLKKNITRIENASDKISLISGYDFTWKKSNKKGIGFIAQEIQRIAPELVEEHDGTLMLDDRGLVAILVEAHKEHQEEIASLKAILGTLLNRLTALENKA